ncbi:MAG: lipid-A-disaccharide synthase [Cyanobacteriota bacterium]|nr:lipid-A-disaccharide synthase [Cyanobacteriota bacterium]
MQKAQDILILSNGPGELATWVRPAVRELRKQLTEDRSQLRISVILSPCPNATGTEDAIARSYPEIDRVQPAKHFFPFLLWGKTAEQWDWREQGIVLFLGGDQFFPLIIGKRLGYRTVLYAEWEARWWRWCDRFGVMNASVLEKIPPRYRSKFTVVGDLMADVSGEREREDGETGSRGAGGDGEQGSRGRWGDGEMGRRGDEDVKKEQTTKNTQPRTNDQGQMTKDELIGLLPGSKWYKLMVGVPLLCAIAELIHQQRPHTRFVIPVAPTVNLETLAKYGDPQQNPVIAKVGNVSAQLVVPENEPPYLKTSGGLRLDIATHFPAYDLLSQCQLCLTTIGANTAELGALAVPMLVLIPTQQLDAMRAWDGLPGILVNLPGIGTNLAKLINAFVVRQTRKQKRLYAWPNLWAKAEIVPELLGELQPKDIAIRAIELLENPENLTKIHDRLRRVRGKPGAAEKLATLVGEELKAIAK